jgi:hypothetical protein
MNLLAEFYIDFLPPSKKNKYRAGCRGHRGFLYLESGTKAELKRCTEAFAWQWGTRDAMTGDVQLHASMKLSNINRDAIGVLESIYDCLQEAKVIKNDRQIRGGSHETTQGEDSAWIRIYPYESMDG